MAKIEGPLFSIGATGSIGDNLSIRSKDKLHVVQKYNKPGDKTPFESSPKQKDQRGIIGLITIYWECMTPAVKETWNKLAKSLKQPITGYSYFIRMAQKNLLLYLGLVGYWSFNYNVGDQVYDLSGNGNHGILSPSYPSDCPKLDTSINSKFGQALSFDGINNYLNIFSGINLSSPFPLITIELLVKKNPSDVCFFLRKSINNIRLGFLSTNSLWITLRSATSDIIDAIILSITLINNIWYGLSFTYNSYTGILNLYLNGLLIEQRINLIGIIGNDSSPLYLGVDSPGTYPFTGLLDELHIWNRELSPIEILKHYNLFRI